MGETEKFTPVEILGMLFKHLKQMAEKHLDSPVEDCVIGIPSYFTDLQRREYLDSATIAGLKPLMLMNDGTATALGYGMYKTDLSDKGPTIVVFVDIGHCDTQVTVAAFEQRKMKILSHTFDPNLGGRDFDELLFKHFAAQFKKQDDIDVHSNARASIRLRASCEKLKRVLSVNTEAPLSIECLVGDTDVKGIMTREEFEKLSKELLKRVTIPCRKAVRDSCIRVDKIYTVELVGSGSRIPAIMKELDSYFKKEPTRTLNASECVARGCALRCAMFSPTLQVQRPYEVQDFFPYSIGLPIDEGQNNTNHEITLFPKGSSFPANSQISYKGTTPLHFHVFYTNKKDFPAVKSPKVGHFIIGPPEYSGKEEVKTEIEVHLNQHGMVVINSA
ncbi:heat shock 70 kDa protein 16-like protein, partial [Tanacetum coccineum]